MTTHMLLPAAERIWRPWKNGGGEMATITLSGVSPSRRSTATGRSQIFLELTAHSWWSAAKV
jgi:environmental stress-induced protein Ves